MKIQCSKFRPFNRNTLRGFCDIKLVDLDLAIKDVAIHEKNSSRWAALPAKPQLKDGVIVKDADGKGQYVNILEFGSRDRRDEFSEAVIAAVLAIAPDAFEVPF
jgi:hypothetical protein